MRCRVSSVPLPLVPPWYLEWKTFAQWLPLLQFRHLDPYAGHLSLGCKSAVRTFLGFVFIGIPFSFKSMNFSVVFTIKLFQLGYSGFVSPWNVNSFVESKLFSFF